MSLMLPRTFIKMFFSIIIIMSVTRGQSLGQVCLDLGTLTQK